MKKIIFVFAVLLIFSLGAMAQTKKADVRNKAQHARIAEGTASGELTKRESQALRAEQRHIKRTKKRAKADGKVTRKERAVIDKKQDRANRHIRNQKHDGQKKDN